MRNNLIRAGFAYRTPPNGSRRLALGHFKAPLQVPAQEGAATAEAPRRPSGAGGGEERAGRARCPLANALLCPKRKSSGNQPPTPIIFLACPRVQVLGPALVFPPVDTVCSRSCRLANAQLILEPSLNNALSQIGQYSRGSDFGPDGFCSFEFHHPSQPVRLQRVRGDRS